MSYAVEPEVERALAVLAKRAGLQPHEVELVRATIAGVPRDDLAPGVPRDTLKTWVRLLLRRTGAVNLQDLALRVARDALRMPRAPDADALSGAIDRLTRGFADDVHALLKQGATAELRRALTPRDRNGR